MPTCQVPWRVSSMVFETHIFWKDLLGGPLTRRERESEEVSYNPPVNLLSNCRNKWSLKPSMVKKPGKVLCCFCYLFWGLTLQKTWDNAKGGYIHKTKDVNRTFEQKLYVPVKSKLKHPPGHTPGIWRLFLPGREGIWLTQSSRGRAFDRYSLGVGNLIASLDFM